MIIFVLFIVFVAVLSMRHSLAAVKSEDGCRVIVGVEGTLSAMFIIKIVWERS